jgi:hypothetical protein
VSNGLTNAKGTYPSKEGMEHRGLVWRRESTGPFLLGGRRRTRAISAAATRRSLTRPGIWTGVHVLIAFVVGHVVFVCPR